MRILFLFLVFIFFNSCQFFSIEKNKTQQKLDTVINFNKIDASPFFSSCKDKIDTNRTHCFRQTIHKKITDKLSGFSFKVKDSIHETLTVTLLISAKGELILQKIESSVIIKKELPHLDSLLQTVVNDLPTVFPGTKRGIPVTTKYALPIRILLQ